MDVFRTKSNIWWSSLAKIIKNFQPLTIYAKKLYCRCSTGLYIHQCSLAYFATAVQLMPLFWEAAAILKLECIFVVIVTACDGVCHNRKFYQLHNTVTNNLNRLCYKAVSFYAELRSIYFFSDLSSIEAATRGVL